MDEGVMRRTVRLLFAAAMLCCASGLPAAEEQGATVTFRVYYLISGKITQKEKLPERAARGVKTCPVKVREYTLPAPGLDYTVKPFPDMADAVITALGPLQRSNAVAVASAVADFVSNSIQVREAAPELSADPHTPPLTALQALKGGSATPLEKCRLACALLRYFEIPARIASWKDSYVVEYYLKPAGGGKAEPAWHVMDPSGRYAAEGDRTEPVAWHPVKAAELLDVEWKGASLSVQALPPRNLYPEGSEAEILADYDNICAGKDAQIPSAGPSGSFYLIKTADYRVTFAQGVTAAAVELTMPFNENKPFKTVKFFVAPVSAGLVVDFKRSHTYINPPNSGLVYTLPVKLALASPEQ